jgi:Raf kinase inhibitor-like YbhB/YbcL family protein
MKMRYDVVGLAITKVALLLVFIWAVGCGGGTSEPAEDPSLMTIHLTSPSFQEGGMIPKTYTCDGEDRSPPLEWSGVPDSARSLVLICDDRDAPRGTWAHWVVFNIPPEVKSFGEGLTPEETLKLGAELTARQGKNDFGKIGYGGPCPPSGTHRYFFRLYALDAAPELGTGPTRPHVLKAITGHILAEGRLMGKYSRSS